MTADALIQLATSGGFAVVIGIVMIKYMLALHAKTGERLSQVQDQLTGILEGTVKDNTVATERNTAVLERVETALVERNGAAKKGRG